MTDLRLAGGKSLIGFHRLVSGDAGTVAVSELQSLAIERAGRTAKIIAFPQRTGGERTHRQPLFCEICRFPALRRMVSAAGR